MVDFGCVGNISSLPQGIAGDASSLPPTLSSLQVPWTPAASSASSWARLTPQLPGTNNSQCCLFPWLLLALQSPDLSQSMAWMMRQVRPGSSGWDDYGGL